MATEFKLPELGENIETGDVVKVLVAVGDTIQPKQAVVELETDKATVEVPSSVGGQVKEIFVKEGQKIKVGERILAVESEAAAEKQAEPKKEEQPKKEAQPREKTQGAPAEAAKAKAPEQTEPVKEEKAEPEGRADIGRQEVVSFPRRAVSEPSGEREGQAGSARSDRTASDTRHGVTVQKVAPAAPSVRRLAREIGVDINQVPGSGPEGRISIEDVKESARRLNTSRGGAAISEQAIVPPLPDFAKWGEIERKPMSSLRRRTAEHMTQAWTIPHVTHFDKADITELEHVRERFAKKVEAAGGKITITAIALKVTAAALKIFPQFNASLDIASNEVILKKYIHIGVAVDTDRGLLVPVIRDADKKNIVALAVELSEAAERARSKKLTLEEMQGGCFTITNLGGIGGTAFSPIVNSPEVAILGIARGGMEPVFNQGQFEPRMMVPLSLSYDHRLIDGADAARFLRWIAGALEQPFLMMLEG